MKPLNPLIINLGLVIGCNAITWLISAAAGGWRFGNLIRCLDLSLEPAQAKLFLDRLHQRRSELGFVPTRQPDEFLQGGAGFQGGGAFTHAKTPKLLAVAVDDSNPSQTRIQVTLRYQELIAADTGESAYRDAVLDYVSGRADALAVVPNQSFLAICSLVSGVVAWILLLGCHAAAADRIVKPVAALAITYFLLGAYALIVIALKRGRVVGLPWAIGGVVTNGTAFTAALLLKLIHI